ncbi:transposase family protein [Streptomyces sp. NBC_01236]|uniref:transposase family protein n=1 Tax=Streptomyces sp. NBC_01236 TaxID=2903789 RepID=UPI002E120396
MFTDRLLVTLVHLRLGLPHAALATLYAVDRSTLSEVIREVRALLAARGFAVPDRPGVRLRTLEDLFAYSDAEGVDLRIDGTEVQVRRPRAGRPGRKAFVSGKKKQNTIKTTTFSDTQGCTLLSRVVRPGRMHDQTAVRTEGIAELFIQHARVKAEVDEGYRGLANEFPDQVAPRRHLLRTPSPSSGGCLNQPTGRSVQVNTLCRLSTPRSRRHPDGQFLPGPGRASRRPLRHPAHRPVPRVRHAPRSAASQPGCRQPRQPRER